MLRPHAHTRAAQGGPGALAIEVRDRASVRGALLGAEEPGELLAHKPADGVVEGHRSAIPVFRGEEPSSASSA
jgi:hypothetical protein